MFKVNSRNKITNDRKLEESIGFVSNKILNGCKEKNIVVAFTSSLISDHHDLIIDKIINMVNDQLQNYNKSTFLCKNDFANESTYSINEKIKELKSKNNITLIKTKSVNIYSSVLEVLKCCDMIICVERYGKSKYANFEEMLEYLRCNSLNIDGVIGCK